MADPAQQPPQARGVHAAGIVIGHDLGAVADAQRRQRPGQRAGVRQGMAPVGARLRAAERVFQMHIGRPGKVAGIELALARPGVRQLEAAVQNPDPVRLGAGQGLRQFIRADQGGVHA
ncbi:hypothetical protein D3C81_1872420 [compost metagenome]